MNEQVKKLIFHAVEIMKDHANLGDLTADEQVAYMLAIDDALIIINSTDVSQAAIDAATITAAESLCNKATGEKKE